MPSQSINRITRQEMATSFERNYPITVSYSEEDECFVAKSPPWALLAACGDTEVEAVKQIIAAIAEAIQVTLKHGKHIPDNDPIMEALIKYRPVLKISKIARMSNINENTLRSKLDRRTAFKPEESNRIRKTMEELGIFI